MKMIKKILLLSLLVMPIVVLATGEDLGESLGLLIMPAFISIHMTLFVLVPLAQTFSGPEEYKGTVKLLFVTRIIILAVLYILIGNVAFFLDFFAVFLGAFLVVPIVCAIHTIKLK